MLPSAAPHVPTHDDVYRGYLIPKGTIVLSSVWYAFHCFTLILGAKRPCRHLGLFFIIQTITLNRTSFNPNDTSLSKTMGRTSGTRTFAIQNPLRSALAAAFALVASWLTPHSLRASSPSWLRLHFIVLRMLKEWTSFLRWRLQADLSPTQRTSRTRLDTEARRRGCHYWVSMP
jgi:hypothetical protein